MIEKTDATKPYPNTEKKEDGFSLIEVIIALLILTIAILGIFGSFAYATVYNGGNNRRSQALAVLQKEAELLRGARFTRAVTDNYTPGTVDDGRRDITGGTKTPRTVTVDGMTYLVQTVVDNDPANVGIQQNDSATPTPTLKEITLTVTPQATTGGWVVSVPVKIVFQRVRSN